MKAQQERIRRCIGSMVLIGLLAGVSSTAAKTTVSQSDGNWDAITWSEGAPAQNDTVTIAHNVALTNSPPALTALTVSAGKTLTFSGWETALTAGVVTVVGTVTHTEQSDIDGTPGIYETWTPDNRVWFVCENLTVATNGIINVDGKGYVSPLDATVSQRGRGPGAYTQSTYLNYGGAGYGGLGRDFCLTLSGYVYGSADNPIDPGSSGGTWKLGYRGGNGGGAVCIEATGAVSVEGTISANGTTGQQYSGGGSGGGISIRCATFNGKGQIQARGGNSGSVYAGGGGGGRIAVHYSDATAQSALSPQVTFTLRGGKTIPYAGYEPALEGDMGTLYLSGSAFLPDEVMANGIYQLIIPGFTHWAPHSLTVTNGWFIFDGLTFAVTNNVTIGQGGKLDVSGAVFGCDSLLVTNGGHLIVAAAATNGTPSNPYGARIDVAGTLCIATQSMVEVYSHATNGGSVFIQAENVHIAAGGALSANGTGFGATSVHGYGPGRGKQNYGGGGYGGRGGYYNVNPHQANRGPSYGCSNAPTLPGSAGAGYSTTRPRLGGRGGGLIWLATGNRIHVDGTLSANGEKGRVEYGTGGSGGGINLYCRVLSGSGAILARGGDKGTNEVYPSGGGGGRIAIRKQRIVWTGTALDIDAVKAGMGCVTSGAAEDGTIMLFTLPANGTLLLIR